MAVERPLWTIQAPKSPRSQEIESLNIEIDTLKDDAENYRQLIGLYSLQRESLREERTLLKRQVEVLTSRLEKQAKKSEKDKTQLMVCAAIAIPVFSFFFYQIGKKSRDQ